MCYYWTFQKPEIKKKCDYIRNSFAIIHDNSMKKDNQGVYTQMMDREKNRG